MTVSLKIEQKCSMNFCVDDHHECCLMFYHAAHIDIGHEGYLEYLERPSESKLEISR